MAREKSDMVSEVRDKERAQLWGLYFNLRGLEEPPPFLLEAEGKLLNHLEGLGPPVVSQPLLHRVK